MSLWNRLTGRQRRAAYTRTSGDLLVNDAGSFVWLGVDSGGGAYPIGPNGPHPVKVLPAVTRLTALITDPLSTVPWTVVQSTPGTPLAGKRLPTPRWLADPQLLRPDSRFPASALPAVQRLPRSAFWSAFIRTAVWHGQSHLLFVEDAAGAPQAGTLRLGDPRQITPVRDESGALVWQLGSGPEAVRADRDGYLEVGQRWRIVTLRDPHAPVDSEGRSVSVFERHADTFGLSGALETYARGVYRSGIPSGYLKVSGPGLTQPQAEELKRKWMEAHGGDTRSVAVLNATTDYTPLTFSPVDAALEQSKRANLADLALAMGLDPAGALGVSMGNSATYANVQQHFARLRQDLLPWITALEELTGSLVPVGQDVRLDFTELTRPEPKEQYEALKVATEAGLLTVDEARGVLGRPPLEAPAPPRQLYVPPAEPEDEDTQPDEETAA